MAVSTTDTYSGPYAANGVTVEFPFTFKALTSDDVGVFIRDSGNDTVVSTDTYSVVLAAEGGTVVMLAPPSVGELYIFSEPSFLQPVNFASGQPFLPSVVNDVTDRDVVRALYLKREVGRAPKTPLNGGAENQFPVVNPDGSWGFSSGTGNDPALRADLATPALGPRLISYDALAAAQVGTVASRLNAIIYLDDVGAVGDATWAGGTDDTPAMQRAIDRLTLTNGGTIRLRRGKRYYFASSFELPRGVRLIGDMIPNKPLNRLPAPAEYSCGIVLAPTATISLGVGCEASGFLCWRAGTQTPVYPAIDVAATLAIIAGFAGTAFKLVGDDASLHHVMGIGFNKFAVANGVFRPSIYQCHWDCTNGIEATDVRDCGEMPGISFNRGWPYLIGSQPYPWRVNRREGICFDFHDVCDGLIAVGNFSYGYATSARMKDVYAMRLGVWADNFGFGDPANIAGAVGILTEGNCNNCVIADCHVDAHNEGYKLLHNAGDVRIEASTCGLCVQNQVTFGAGSSGTIHMSIAGPTQTPISVLAGVGDWSGEIRSRSTATSGNLIFFANFLEGYRLSELRRIQIGTTLADPLAGGNVSSPAFRPNPGLRHGMYTPSDTRLGFAVNQKDVLHLKSQAASVNYLLIESQGTAGGPALIAEGTDTNIPIAFIPKGSSTVRTAGTFIPTSDNTFAIGASSARFSAIYAVNGAIQTSDPGQKTDIALIDPSLAVVIVSMIDPIFFKWISGGQTMEAVDVEIEEPVTETVQIEVYDEELIDGKLVRTPRLAEEEQPIMDMVDVVDPDGNPILVDQEHLEAPEPGEMRPKRSVRPVPMQRAVPRTHKVMRSVMVPVERAGARTHAGWNARQVQEALRIVDQDFGGFVITADGSLALRPDQMTAVLWAAMRWVLMTLGDLGATLPDIPTHPDHLTGVA